jgi:glyoxylate reductase
VKPKIYVTRMIPGAAIDLLSECCDVAVHDGEGPCSAEELRDKARDRDGLLVLTENRIDSGILDAAPGLRVISTVSVGYEHIDILEATRRGIYLGFTPGVLTDATADLTFTLLLSAARRVVEADSFVRAGNWKSWSPTLMLGASVWGKTLGIVGFGRIGQAVARRAGGFGMKILYSDVARASTADEAATEALYRRLEELLGESDFVSLHVPLTPDTYHLINESRLRLMKRDAILVNTSRGPTVDEEALVRALKEGWIKGAGLDVYEKEPLESSSPLLGLGNVTLLPHVGSATMDARKAMAELGARNLLAVLHGEKPLAWLNPEVEKVRSLAEVRMI